jgi:putative heme-binding domain-containing protein
MFSIQRAVQYPKTFLMKKFPSRPLSVFTGVSSCLISSCISLNALPEGWTITEYAAPPQMDYPSAISAAASGDVYISSDPNGSIGHNPEFGKVIRASDSDGDGKADEFLDFVPKVSSPRGGDFVGDTLYLIHPPYLSAFRDTTGDGVADEHKVLVKGFGWGIEHPRGADHTTNGVRMGIDGWLYVAVGDFGMPEAVGADGKTYTLWGGGVVRVRPDGSEMEPYSLYVRNICDIAITPTMDMFSRDNTNDGKGWNTRFHHFVPMGDHGYPRLYQNFADEIVTPLKDFGGGSGTGALALNEPGFPKEYRNAIFTADWTTGNIYLHPMKPMEATYEIGQEVFHKLPRAIDIDVDGSSRLYLADWRNGRFNYDKSQKIGMIQQVLPPDWKKTEFPNLKELNDAALVELIASDSAVMRLEAQREMVARGEKAVFADRLFAISKDSGADLFKRVAAIFTFKQIYGTGSTKYLTELVGDEALREYALRAMADRMSEMEGVPVELFVKCLNDINPRVRVQALNGLARLGAKDAAPAILASMADADLNPGEVKETERRIVPHVAVKALVSLGADEACLASVKNPHERGVALRALQEMHTGIAVDGLISQLAGAEDQQLIVDIFAVLARLHFKEAEWDLEEWWHTRPDDRGPYFQPTEWEGTQKISDAIVRYFPKISENRRSAFISLLAKNRIAVSKMKLDGLDPLMIALSELDPDDSTLTLLVDAAADPERTWEQRLLAYRAISRANAVKAVPAQVKTLAVWIEQEQPEAQSHVSDFVNDTPRFTEAKILNKIAKNGSETESMIAWKALLTVFTSPLVKDKNKLDVENLLSENPLEVGLFLAIADMKLSGFDQQIAAGLDSDNKRTITAAAAARDAAAATGDTGKKIGEMTKAEVMEMTMSAKGDPENGKRLFVAQGCIACHAVDIKAVQKGPYLGSAGSKFTRDYLIESITDPNAVVAQGFQTVLFTMKDGTTAMGFVTNEEDGVIQLRDIGGNVSELKREDVDAENHLPQSMMPAGLGDSLGSEDFVDLIEYLNSLSEIGG